VEAGRSETLAALDWTDADNQSTLVLSMITSPGRAKPPWKTVMKSELQGWRKEHARLQGSSSPIGQMLISRR
jgi:hypothetical protein